MPLASPMADWAAPLASSGLERRGRRIGCPGAAQRQAEDRYADQAHDARASPFAVFAEPPEELVTCMTRLLDPLVSSYWPPASKEPI